MWTREHLLGGFTPKRNGVHRTGATSEADALHFRTDIWSSSVVILGLAVVWLAAQFHLPAWVGQADAVAALGVSAIVIGVSTQLLRETVDALLDRAPEAVATRVAAAIRAVAGVLTVRQVRVRRAGNKFFADAVVSAPRTWTFAQTHALTEQLFASLASSLPPTEQIEKQFLRLYAQTQRLHAIMLIERQQHGAALLAFNDMLRIAEELGEPSTTALALMGIGTELERAGRQLEAVDRLEQARDISFQASRQVAALINAYLARAYASNKDAVRFQRAIDTAENIATTLGDAYGNGETMSSIASVGSSLSGAMAIWKSVSRARSWNCAQRSSSKST